jgi:HSP20 family protein
MILTRFRPSVRRWEATLNDFDRMRREFEDFADLFNGGRSVHRFGVFPATNVTQDADNFYVRMELPGVKIEDLDVSVVDRKIAISGKRELGVDEDGVSYHRRERESGSFSRNIELPSEFDRDSVEASYLNGVLTIRVPRTEAARPKQIAVKTS